MEKAQVWIYSTNDRGEARVLLLKLVPERGSHYHPMTGAVEPGESVEAGALREVFEETGFRSRGELIPLDFDFSYEGRWGRAHETAFALEAEPGCPEPALDPAEHVGYAWVRLDEARTLVHHDVHREALARLQKRLDRA